MMRGGNGGAEAARAAADRRYVLALDTSGEAVSACLFDRHRLRVFAEESLAMERGHAEALIPLLDRLFGDLSDGLAALERVSVTVGPGSFTGIRVGVACARALGLAAKIPVVGVSTLVALAAPLVSGASKNRIIAAVDARHGGVYAQGFLPDGTTFLEARHGAVGDILEVAGQDPVRLVGSGAPMLAIEAWSRGTEAEVIANSTLPRISLVARLGMLADPEQAPPKPLYLKPPDAKLPAPVETSPTPAPVS